MYHNFFLKMCLKILIIYSLIFIAKITSQLLSDVIKLTKSVDPLTKSVGLIPDSKLSLLNLLTNNILETPDGGTISEGDIVTYGKTRVGLKQDGDLWPDAIIPYVFHKSIESENKKLIIEAIKHWEESTCIRFRQKKPKDEYFVRFRADTSGCWSAIGRQYDKTGPQDISLGNGCFKFYTAVHEIGHTIGYSHEHSRKDRNDFIEILWDNVKTGMTSQFEIKETRNEGFEYDYRSIMHYPAWAFSKKPLNKSVIVAKNPFVQYLIDEEKDSLSFRDIKLTNMLYKCHDKCPNIGVTECKNNGFLMYKSHKKTCLCRCPPGINGKNCELNEENKIDLYKPKCGGHITKQGQFWTPNYPNRKHPYESCSYWIQAPDEHTVEVTFHDFSFNEPYFGENNEAIEGLCLHETIEIRNLDNIYDGNQYCGQQITRNTIMNSIGKDFIIIIIADDQMIGRGLNASIRFIKNDSNEEILQISPKSRPRRVNTNKLKQNVNQLEISDIIGI